MTRTKPRTRKPARKSRPPQKNRVAREGWKFPHVFDGVSYPPIADPAAWVSTTEAAAMLGVSLKTVKKYLVGDSPVLSSKRHGYFRLVKRADVVALAGRR